MTLVKICGLMTPEHVEAAVENGADFIGFVFAPSRREVTVEQAAALAKYIPPHVKKVGVFVNETVARMRHIAAAVPLDYVQFHGDEPQSVIDAVGYPAIKAFSVRSADDVAQAATYNVDYYLFDAPGTDFRGGSGHVFNWTLLKEAGIHMNNVLLAGGLHVDNVRDAICDVQPVGVDVSSGVETNKVKDSTKIRAFLQAAKGANV